MRHAIVGATSYAFRYLLQDERRAPRLGEVVEQASRAGLAALQVCENARPLSVSAGEWGDAVRRASGIGLALHVGCTTMDVETLGRYLDLAAATPGAGALRIVLEQEGGPLPSRESIVRFLDAAMPRLEAAGRALAIENHFHIPCRLLAEVAETYPAELVRFCIDSANSLRNWEAPEDVFRLLGGRAEFYHLKDYAVSGSNVGFQVGGAPLGCGQLNLRWCLEEMFRRHATPLVLLENWVPASGNWEEDVAADGKWLVRSLEGLRAVLPA